MLCLHPHRLCGTEAALGVGSMFIASGIFGSSSGIFCICTAASALKEKKKAGNRQARFV